MDSKWTIAATLFTITNVSALAYHMYLRKSEREAITHGHHLHLSNDAQVLKSTTNLLDSVRLQKEELSQQLIEKMERITSLETVIISLQNQLQTLQQTIENLNHENKVLRDSIPTPITPYTPIDTTSLENEIIKLKQEKIDLLKQLEKSLPTHQFLSQQTTASKDLHDKLHGMSIDLDGLKIQLEQQLISNQSLQELVNKIKEDKQHLEDSLFTANQETMHWKNKFDSIVETTAQLEKEKQIMETLVKQFHQTIASQLQENHLKKLTSTTQEILSIVNIK